MKTSGGPGTATEHAAAGGADRAVAVARHQLEGGQHGLVVLVLVLHDQADDKAAVEQRIGAVEGEPVEHVERPVAESRRRRRAPRSGPSNGSGRPVRAGVAEGVVEIVEGRRRPGPSPPAARTSHCSS